MDTSELVRSLAADHEWRARPVGTVLAMALGLALPVAAVMFAVALGVRPDVATALANPFFVLKFAVTLSLAVASVMLAGRLARPGASGRGVAWLLVTPVALLVAGIVVDLTLPHASAWTARLAGSNAVVCLTAIPALSLPLLVAALLGLRHGASTRPMLSGAVAGLLSGAIAATLYAAHCIDDSPLFVATWYVIAIAIVSIVGAALGRSMLRI